MHIKYAAEKFEMAKPEVKQEKNMHIVKKKERRKCSSFAFCLLTIPWINCKFYIFVFSNAMYICYEIFCMYHMGDGALKNIPEIDSMPRPAPSPFPREDTTWNIAQKPRYESAIYRHFRQSSYDYFQNSISKR